MKKLIRARFAALGATAIASPVLAVCALACAPEPATITYDATTRYQTMTGWEASAWAAEDDANFDSFKDVLLDTCADEVGINRIRMTVHAGTENPRDYWSEERNGLISRDEFRAHRYDTVNDDADPDNIDPDGFQFAQLDFQVENVVLPMVNRLAANGERLHVNLCYVAFTDQNASGATYIHDDPDEYAEFILATTQHLESKYDLVPDTWEVILEPDLVDEWNGTTVGNALVATESALSGAGFTPAFAAPSTTNMGNAVSFFDAMANVNGALDSLSEISYHLYSGDTQANRQALASRAATHGIKTAQLEKIRSTYLDLHKDLKDAHCSAWQQFTIGSPYGDSGATYVVVDRTDPDNPTARPGDRAKFLTQYFKYVRLGAVRVGATSSSSNLDPVAFENTDSGAVVVVKADGAEDFIVEGLPAGVYGIRYTTSSEYAVDLQDATITEGEGLPTGIPGVGVLTVYDKTPDAPPPPGVIITTEETLPEATSGELRTYTFAATSGTPPYGWSILSGTLPVDAAIDPDTGVLSGLSAAPNTYQFVVRVTDSLDQTFDRTFTAVVNARPNIVTPKLPTGAADRAFTSGVQATGGTAPLTWSLHGDVGPAGIGIDPTSGALTGTPPAAGHFDLTARCTDACGAVDETTFDFGTASVVALKKRSSSETLAFESDPPTAPIWRALELLGGTKLSVSLRFPKGVSAADVEVSLLDSAEQALPIDEHLKTKKRGRSLQLKGFEVPTTGRFFLVIEPLRAFEGSVRMSVSAQAPKKLSADVELGAGEVEDINFPVLPGAKFRLVVSAPRKSAALPAILSVVDDAAHVLASGDDIREGKRSASVKLRGPLQGGDVAARIGIRDGQAGTITWKARVAVPRHYSFEVTAAAGFTVEPDGN